MDDESSGTESSPVSLSASVGWGLAALLIGCTLLISGCTLMVFNVILFQVGMLNVNVEWAQRGGMIGVAGVAVLGIFSVWCGVRGWSAAIRRGESPALGIAGFVSGLVGFVAWAIPGIDLLAILRVI